MLPVRRDEEVEGGVEMLAAIIAQYPELLKLYLKGRYDKRKSA